MRGVVLVHSSDLHVDDDGVPKHDPAGGYDGLSGLASVLATAQAIKADLVLLVGDTFDNHRVSASVLMQASNLLAVSPVSVVILPGNHDPVMPPCLYHRSGIVDLPHVHVLGIANCSSLQWPDLDLEIWGHAHRDYGDMAPLRSPPPRTTRWQVALAHGHYLPPEDAHLAGQRAWQITDQDLADTGADYIALGHWDRPVSVGDGSVPAHYSGSPDLAKTANLVLLDPRSGVTIRREPLRQP